MNSKAEIRNASIFIVAERESIEDQIINSLDIRLIDLGHFKFYEKEEERDIGFLKGLETLIRLV